MAYSEYWNPKNETMPREDLERLQLHKLQQLCQWAYNTTPFHRRHFEEAGVKPEDIKTLDDIRRLPFMTREAWMDSQVETPMFGDLLSTDKTNAIPITIERWQRRSTLMRLTERVLGPLRLML